MRRSQTRLEVIVTTILETGAEGGGAARNGAGPANAGEARNAEAALDILADGLRRSLIKATSPELH